MISKTFNSSESIDITKMCDDLLNTIVMNQIKTFFCGAAFGVALTLTAMRVIG